MQKVNGLSPDSGGLVTLTAADVGALTQTTADARYISYLGPSTTAAQLQAVINGMSGGGTIHLAAGTYTFTSTITLASNITIAGAGETATIITASHNSDAFAGVDLSHVCIRDLRVDGPGHAVGNGSAIKFTLSGMGGNATYYVCMANLYLSEFKVDGVSIATPIVSSFSRVVSLHMGRHGIYLYGDHALGTAGNSTTLSSCFSAGCYGAGYRFADMAYSVINACASDAVGIAYDYENCLCLRENGCGSEEPYDFSAIHAGYAGYSRRINGCIMSISSPYALGNIGASYYVLGSSRISIDTLYEAAPGAGATASLRVVAGCSVQLLGTPSYSTALDVATNTTSQPTPTYL